LKIGKDFMKIKMSLQRDFEKYLSGSIFLTLLLLIIISCKKEDVPINDDEPLIRKEDSLKTYSPTVKFEVTGRLLEGKRIDCIEPDYKGNTWIASGQELFHYKNGTLENSYTLDFSIRDISIAGDESLWIATSGGGLGHITKDAISWFTVANSGIPRDYIANVEVGLDGRIWFSSGAHDYGGLVVYDGKKFDLFTHDNSMLNQHVIDDIGIDHNGAIYVMTLSKVNKTNIYRVSEDSWECLGNENGTFYWVTVVSVSPSRIIYLLEDFMLSSTLADTNNFYVYKNNEWKRLKPDFMNSRLSFFTALKADRRDYCWAADIEGNSYLLHVFNGSEWESAPPGLFNGDKISTIETDFDNNIWIGTAKNGVFILKQ
jgi:ligand-binding sensor domain-containing protein